MIIKKLSECESFIGLNNITSELLRLNNLNPNNFDTLFPDLFMKNIQFRNTISKFSVLKETDKFIDFINNNKDKKFCIVGDNDCDGIMSTVILKTTLQLLGIDVISIVPNRLTESYGMSNNHVDWAIENNADIIITVDNGIACKESVKYAKSKGLEVIITDHHLPIDGLIPENCLIIDPKYNNSNDSFSDICGAFVAFKLCYALLNSNNNQNQYFISEIATFAGIATITDMMPVLNENRLLLKGAFDYISFLKNKNVWSGRVLKVISGFNGYDFIEDKTKVMTENLIAFKVGPSINAVGRIKGDVNEVVNEICDCDQHGKFLKFGSFNFNRKKQTNLLLEEYTPNDELINFEIIDQSKYDFPVGGLVGLIANKLSTEEKKLSLVGHEDKENNLYQFSCRSIPGYSIHDAFQRIKTAHPELELQGGGHATAMGIRFPLDKEKADNLKKYLTEDFEKYGTKIEKVYYQLEPENIDQVVNILNMFKPFGSCFKQFTFIYKGIFRGYNSDTKVALIGDYNFEIFIPEASLENELYKPKTILFDIKFDKADGPYFKAFQFTEKEGD